MKWNRERIEQIPEVYRDFMLALSPIVSSNQPGFLGLRVNGVPLNHIFNSLATRHHYSPQELREIARVLKQQGLIAEDALGFFKPTAQGESLINSLLELEQPAGPRIPPFPEWNG